MVKFNYVIENSSRNEWAQFHANEFNYWTNNSRYNSIICLSIYLFLPLKREDHKEEENSETKKGVHSPNRNICRLSESPAGGANSMSRLAAYTTKTWGIWAHGERATFTRLVLGNIEADLCSQIFVGNLSPRSTQCTPSHRSLISNCLSNFRQKIAKNC